MAEYWDAQTYDKIGTPMQGWAQALMDDLGLKGHEVVLDAGCGSGSVTRELAKRLPQGKIYALDSSAEMIAMLKQSSCDWSGDCEVVPVHASLTDFELPESVECIFSNAVFHWIPDDDALFSNLFRAVRKGGRLRAQCGGAGNISRVYEAVNLVQCDQRFAEYFRGFQDAKKYRSVSEAKETLEQAGWCGVMIRTFNSPVDFESVEAAAQYLGTIILRDHVAILPLQLAEDYLYAIIETSAMLFGNPFSADYVRLDMSASSD